MKYFVTRIVIFIFIGFIAFMFLDLTFPEFDSWKRLFFFFAIYAFHIGFKVIEDITNQLK